MSLDERILRRALPGDRSAMLDLWERSARASHHFLTGDDIDGLRPQVEAELATDRAEWWVVTSGDAVVAFLAYSPGCVEGLFVDPLHVGTGAGTLLVEHARRLGGGDLRVDVNQENAGARRFYESRGFTVVGRSPKDDAGRPFPILHMRLRR